MIRTNKVYILIVGIRREYPWVRNKKTKVINRIMLHHPGGVSRAAASYATRTIPFQSKKQKKNHHIK